MATFQWWALSDLAGDFPLTGGIEMFKKTIIAGGMLAIAASAQAQSTASVTVTGTIMPSACGVTLGSGGGTAAFGDIASSVITAKTAFSFADGTKFYETELSKTMSFTVTCPTPAKFGLYFEDNKAGTSISTNDDEFGLGMFTPSAGATPVKIGAFYMNLQNIKVKKTATDTAVAAISGMFAAGRASSTSVFVYDVDSPVLVQAKRGYTVAWSDLASATVPASLTSLTGDMSVLLRLSKTAIDAAGSPMTLDGSATITLVGL